MTLTPQLELTKQALDRYYKAQKQEKDMLLCEFPTNKMEQLAYEAECAAIEEEVAVLHDAARRAEDRNEFWITANGRVLHISELTDGHLVNAVRWMHKNYDKYLLALPFDYEPLLIHCIFPKLRTLVTECKERGLNCEVW